MCRLLLEILHLLGLLLDGAQQRRKLCADALGAQGLQADAIGQDAIQGAGEAGQLRLEALEQPGDGGQVGILRLQRLRGLFEFLFEGRV